MLHQSGEMLMNNDYVKDLEARNDELQDKLNKIILEHEFYNNVAKRLLYYAYETSVMTVPVYNDVTLCVSFDGPFIHKNNKEEFFYINIKKEHEKILDNILEEVREMHIQAQSAKELNSFTNVVDEMLNK